MTIGLQVGIAGIVTRMFWKRMGGGMRLMVGNGLATLMLERCCGSFPGTYVATIELTADGFEVVREGFSPHK